MSTLLAILSVLLAFMACWVVVMNWACVIMSLRNQRRGIDRHHSTVPFFGQILLGLAGLSSSFIPRWLLWSVGLADLSLWMMVGFFCALPFRRNSQPPQSNPPEASG